MLIFLASIVRWKLKLYFYILSFLWRYKMKDFERNILKETANTIRQLSMEAIQDAKSGHPGLPLGCAEIGAYLYGEALLHYPKDPKWINRDRFVLSAGHGSMLLYSCLHLSGFDLSLDEIKKFRQLHSKTPGHPEHGITPGVEATAGPLGKGVGNAVGMALGMKILQSKFNTENHKILDNKVYCLASDGCVMEGVSSESSSFAGHLKLDNLVVLYDSNDISLDGKLSDCYSDDTKTRYQSYGWDVFTIDGHNLDAIDNVINKIKNNQKKPVLIIAKTIIGKGSPNKQGTNKSHGSPLGEEELLLTKQSLHLPKEKYYIPQEVINYFKEKIQEQKKSYDNWLDLFSKWKGENPSLYEEFEVMRNRSIPSNLEDVLKDLMIKSPMATRKSSQEIINKIAPIIPSLYGGSADLSSSDMTFINDFKTITKENFNGRNIKFGVREFAMGSIMNGLSLLDMFIPFCGTFLVFSDYMRASIRKAAMCKIKIIYQFTHDSIFLGEDGPSHQPVEHIASLRSIPNLQVIRPADSNEMKMAWVAALNYNGPTALILSRQNLPCLQVTDVSYEDGLSKGAYIIKKEKNKCDFTLFASGSEVRLALDVARTLEGLGKDVRVISFPCFEIFEKQKKSYINSILDGDLGKRVSIEAGVGQGWYKYIGRDGISINIETFGISAPASEIAQEYGFTQDDIIQNLLT
jgi:transketolase